MKCDFRGGKMTVLGAFGVKIKKAEEGFICGLSAKGPLKIKGGWLSF